MSLIKRSFKLVGDTEFDCYIYILNDAYWFECYEILVFLGYEKPHNAIDYHVESKYKKRWDCLNKDIVNQHELQTDLQPSTIFISEIGLYALIMKSSNPEAEKLRDWIYEDVLPSLRKDRELHDRYSEFTEELLVANKALIKAVENINEARQDAERARQDAERARQDAVALSNRMADLVKDVIVKPLSPDLLHCLVVHETDKDFNEITFTRCQRRNLNEAVKHLKEKNPEAKRIYDVGYVPNGINVLNCVKDWLRKNNVPYTARNNTIRLSNESNLQSLIDYIQSIVPKIEPDETKKGKKGKQLTNEDKICKTN